MLAWNFGSDQSHKSLHSKHFTSISSEFAPPPFLADAPPLTLFLHPNHIRLRITGSVEATVHVEPVLFRSEAVFVSGRRALGVVVGGEPGPLHGDEVERVKVVEKVCGLRQGRHTNRSSEWKAYAARARFLPAICAARILDTSAEGYCGS